MRMRLFFVCFCFLFLVNCGGKETKPAGQRSLVIAVSPDNPPFEFKDTAQRGDKVIGFDIDVINELGKRLGRPIQIMEIDFQSIIPALQAGRADMGISGINPTEERRKSVDFSDPYHTDKKALLVLANSTLASEKDLNGKKLGVQLGTTHEALAQTWTASTPGLSLVSLNKGGELVQELKNGRIDAVLTDDAVAGKVAASTPGLKVIILSAYGGPSAIAFPKGSALVAPTNEALKAMKGDIEQLETKWFR